MSILPQTLFPFVRSHFMSFSFFTTWHNRCIYYFNFALIVEEKDFAGLNAGTL